MVKTELIVLGSIDYSESSIISTVLSREHGKIAVIARGARRPKSALSGMLQPGNILGAIYSWKASRSVQTLADADYLLRMEPPSSDLMRVALIMRSMELVGQLLHDGEVNTPVFQFVREFLEWFSRCETVSPLLFPYLQIRMASLIGLQLQVDPDNRESEPGYLNIESGLVSARPAEQNAVPISLAQRLFLSNAATSRKVSLLKQEMNDRELRELVGLIDRYFRYHLDGLKPRRSDAIFDQMLQ